MRASTIGILVLGCWPYVATAESPKPKLAIKGLDPVALVAGQEVRGRADLEVVDHQFAYRFANPENKTKFAARPQDYRIQFGGACGKMGPFSGQGNPDRFYVHDQRIYVFASDFCLDAFKKDPNKHIEKPNAAPTGTEEQRQRGAKLLHDVVRGIGGADQLDAVRSLQFNIKHTYRQGDRESVSAKKLIYSFPGQVRIEESFGNAYGYVVNGETAYEFAGSQFTKLDDEMCEVAWRQLLREPIMMLKHRGDTGFVSIALGSAQFGNTPVELVAVSLRGATSIWSIDPTTGRIIQARYDARRGTVGEITIAFSDFRDVSGLIMPFGRAIQFNGKPVTSPVAVTQSIEVNAKIEPAQFAPAN